MQQKRIAAVLLSLNMLISVFSVNALAAETETPYEHNQIVCEVCEGDGLVATQAQCEICGGTGTFEDGETICTNCVNGFVDTEETCLNCINGNINCDGNFEAGEIINATCTNDGYTPYICGKCGASYSDNLIEAFEHSYGEDGVCTVCGAVAKEQMVEVGFVAVMPDGNKYTITKEVAKNSGEVYFDFKEMINDYPNLTWESNYYISSASANSQTSELVYDGISKLYELVCGFRTTVGENSTIPVNIVISKDSRIAYYVYHYIENLDGSWAFSDSEWYTAVDPTSLNSTGWGPVIGSEYSINPKIIDGYANNRYLPAVMVWWNGFLNSNNYTEEFQQGKADYYTFSIEECGLAYDATTGSFSGVATRQESNFASPIIAYYYALLRPVNYEANGGEGATKTENYISIDTVTIADNMFNRSGYSFTGWNTAADGSGTAYAVGDTFAIGTVESVTLFAQWAEKEEIKPDNDPKDDDDDNEDDDDTPIKPITPPSDDTPTKDEPPEIIIPEPEPELEPDLDAPDEIIIVPDDVPLGDLPQTGDFVEDVPKTGDNSPIFICYLTLVVSTAGLLYLAISSKTKKEF